MNKTLRILVVGHYPPDQLESMKRYALLLREIYSRNSYVELIHPPSFAGGLHGLPLLLRKYLSYFDKFFLFFLILFIKHRSFDVVHVSDHGYAYTCFACPFAPCIVTCHDLLAVRGAKGDIASATGSSPIGIWLQRLIMAGLRRADAIACVSQATFDDYQRLIAAPPRQRHAVIPIPLNAPFSPIPDAFPLSLEEEAQIPDASFLLMVGSSLPRKNRGLALQLLEHLGTSSHYTVVFAGAPLTEREHEFRANSPVGERLVSIPRPSHGLLNRLYCRAHALLFPSIAEGFGWPLLEAQTCHCPVIASPTTSIPEVAGDGALYAGPADVAVFAGHVRALEDPTERARMIALGEANISRFSPEAVGEAYLRLALQA